MVVKNDTQLENSAENELHTIHFQQCYPTGQICLSNRSQSK